MTLQPMLCCVSKLRYLRQRLWCASICYTRARGNVAPSSELKRVRNRQGERLWPVQSIGARLEVRRRLGVGDGKSRAYAAVLTRANSNDRKRARPVANAAGGERRKPLQTREKATMAAHEWEPA